jgi:hypothetical protein
MLKLTVTVHCSDYATERVKHATVKVLHMTQFKICQERTFACNLTSPNTPVEHYILVSHLQLSSIKEHN